MGTNGNAPPVSVLRRNLDKPPDSAPSHTAAAGTPPSTLAPLSPTRIPQSSFTTSSPTACRGHARQRPQLTPKGAVAFSSASSRGGEAVRRSTEWARFSYSYGRPRSAVLLNQLRHLPAPRGSWDYGNLVADQRCLPEILPVEAMRPASGQWRLGGDDHWLGRVAARGAAREAAEAVLRTMRDGTHRYAPPGPWGRAVAEARELARWGAADAAWRVLRDALPLWEAPGALADRPDRSARRSGPGPLVTPERGREFLATPRAGEMGAAPEPVSDLDPPGLA
jgi:hypothetical protein